MTTDNAQQYFIRESDFELALMNLSQEHGWTHEVIVQPSEDDLDTKLRPTFSMPQQP